MKTTRILLVDDHAVLRAGLRLLIGTTKDMQVVGEASDGNAGIVEAQQVRPDVVLMDITMPHTGGLKALAGMRAAVPEAKIVMLTMHDDPAYVRSAFSAGAAGYVLKRSADTDLLNAIRTVVAGKVFVDSTLAHLLDEEFVETADPKAAPSTELSAREREVLTLLARGYTNKEIAQRMHVSIKSVDTYKNRLTTKLGLHTRAELVRYAFELGLLTPALLNDR